MSGTTARHYCYQTSLSQRWHVQSPIDNDPTWRSRPEPQSATAVSRLWRDESLESAIFLRSHFSLTLTVTFLTHTDCHIPHSHCNISHSHCNISHSHCHISHPHCRKSHSRSDVGTEVTETMQATMPWRLHNVLLVRGTV